MNDRDIPVTTLAGLTSVSDLLSELPLSDTLPSHSIANKSLLFHPRVAEEANNLLSQRDDPLAQQLINAIEQTNSGHIDIKPEYAGSEDLNSSDAPHLLRVIESFRPNVFNSSVFNQKYVNPIASSQNFQNAPQSQQNLTQNYSLQADSMHGYDASSFVSPSANNFHNFDQSNQFQPMQYHQQPQQSFDSQYQGVPSVPAQQQTHFMGQSSVVGINNGSTSTYQHSINDLLVQPTAQLQQNLFSSQEAVPATNQSSYNIAQLLDTSSASTSNATTTNNLQQGHLQQQNLNNFYQHSNNLELQLQPPHVESSASTSAFTTFDQSQFHPRNAKVEQNHYNNNIQPQTTQQPKVDNTRNNHQVQQTPQVNNNMHLRSNKDATPRNNEYLVQQQQQRPSPAQGTTAPEPTTNHQNSITKTQDPLAGPVKEHSLMETFDLSDPVMMNFKNLVVQVPKVKLSHEDMMDGDFSGDLFSQMKEDEKRAPMKRKAPVVDEGPETFNQPKLRRIEKKLAPVIQKLSTEELMKTNTYIRFNSFMEKVFEQLDDTEVISLEENDENLECIGASLLSNISAEAAKLKARASIDAIPEEKLTLLINYAMRSVQTAKNNSAGPDINDDLAEDSLEKILNAIEAALLICNIYTSKDTKFLQEDNVDMIIKFVQFQLRETIFPSYDPVYTIETKKKTEKSSAQSKKKQNNQQKGITVLYTKIVELTKLFVKLFNKFHFVDTIIIHASALGVEPFFVDNIETLQFVCLDLVTSIFQNEKYKHHRHNILNDILSSVDRLPHSKRNLRPYKLMNNGGNIQMMTALVLQLIQCSVLLPEELHEDERVSKKRNNVDKKYDRDSFMIEKYKTATSIGGNFIQTFLNKCKSRSTETDFRPLFENFIHDLLTTVNKPEWPASELLLTLLGTLLVKYMADKSVDQSIRVVSLEYLGIVAARLRKDTVKARNRVKTMDELIKCIKAEQEKDGEDSDDEAMFEVNPEEERTEFLQKILLDYLTLNSQEDNPVWNHARHFYLTTWFHDIQRRKKEISEGAKGYASRKKQKSSRKKRYDSDAESSDSDVQEVREVDAELNREIFKILDERKKYLMSKIAPFRKTTRDVVDLKTYLDYDNANLIAQYLASKRRFSQSFDIYLKKIILVVREPVVAIRTRAMKCLGNIVEVDQSILARKDMQIGVQQKLLDAAISVREAAVDLVGKYILTDRSLVDHYYEMIAPRILDTGVSVRKRVIKILRDICVEFPDHPKIPDICIRMLRRVNDEENIQKLVMEVFMTMWFTPCHDNDKDGIARKCEQIIDVELSSQEKGFHGLLKTVFEPKEAKNEEVKGKKEISPTLVRACHQIVNGLVNSIMDLEKTNTNRLVGCVTALHSFAQIRPQLLVEHAISLEPYLNIKCGSNELIKFMSLLAEILEQVVPLMEHPGETFLSEIEAHLMMLIVSSRQIVVISCVGCLGAVINKITKNYPLVRECFSKIYTRALVQTKDILTKNPHAPPEQIYNPVFRRGIFTVGLLMRYFDFSRPDVYGSNLNERNRLSPNICDEVFETLFFFLNSNIQPLRREILQALGYFCVTNCEYLTRVEIREYYNYLLGRICDQNELKIMVLKNILLYLMEEENKMTRNDKDWQTQSKTEDLKEMGDISSGMSSRVIQIYLKEILNCFLNGDFNVRLMAMRVVEIVLRQGLVHPVQIVPYLICLSTDPETEASHSADRHLQEIDKQYQGFVNMKCQLGITLSYELQRILQEKQSGRAIRGYRLPKKGVDEPPGALNGFVYSLLRSTKPNRRALIQSMTKQFDDEKATLSFMLYLADNLAYFPYAVQDEPLYLIHQIDLFISVQGTNLLQTFRDGLKKKAGEENADKINNPLEDEDDEEDREVLFERLPDDVTDLQQCVTSAQGCMLLLILKQHLKDMYGLNDAKISQYSPSESTKVYDKAMQRRNIQPFNPKATIALLKEDPKIGVELSDAEKRVLVDRYLEFKQLMIKLDPDEENEDDDDGQGSPQKAPLVPNTSQAVTQNDVATPTTNHTHLNNVQINLTRVDLVEDSPPHNYEKVNVNSIPKSSQKPAVRNKSSSKKSSSGSMKKKKRRKLSSSDEEESDYDDDDDY